MRIVVAAIVVSLSCASLAAQADRFEVASVKPNTSSTRGTRGIEVLPGGVVRGTNVPLFILVQTAYGLRAKQLDDAPVLNERFDINAKAGASALPDTASPEARRKCGRRHAGRGLVQVAGTALPDECRTREWQAH